MAGGEARGEGGLGAPCDELVTARGVCKHGHVTWRMVPMAGVCGLQRKKESVAARVFGTMGRRGDMKVRAGGPRPLQHNSSPGN